MEKRGKEVKKGLWEFWVFMRSVSGNGIQGPRVRWSPESSHDGVTNQGSIRVCLPGTATDTLRLLLYQLKQLKLLKLAPVTLALGLVLQTANWLICKSVFGVMYKIV